MGPPKRIFWHPRPTAAGRRVDLQVDLHIRPTCTVGLIRRLTHSADLHIWPSYTFGRLTHLGDLNTRPGASRALQHLDLKTPSFSQLLRALDNF